MSGEGQGTAAPSPQPYTPKVLSRPAPQYVAGAFLRAPLGVILHGSRSGKPQSLDREFAGTASYAQNNPGGLCWHATIGEDAVAMHLPFTHWGWNARSASKSYLAVEFAQPTVGYDITDAQVRAFAWWFAQARKAWPALPVYFIAHSELPEGQADGKTDVFPIGDRRLDNLKRRLTAAVGGR